MARGRLLKATLEGLEDARLQTNQEAERPRTKKMFK